MGWEGAAHSWAEGSDMTHVGPQQKAHRKWTQNFTGNFVAKGFVTPVTFGPGTELLLEPVEFPELGREGSFALHNKPFHPHLSSC